LTTLARTSPSGWSSTVLPEASFHLDGNPRAHAYRPSIIVACVTAGRRHPRISAAVVLPTIA
jgi:hypothetical protein